MPSGSSRASAGSSSPPLRSFRRAFVSAGPTPVLVHREVEEDPAQGEQDPQDDAEDGVVASVLGLDAPGGVGGAGAHALEVLGGEDPGGDAQGHAEQGGDAAAQGQS